jgi:predicted CXXCH cytochrome family protein
VIGKAHNFMHLMCAHTGVVALLVMWSMLMIGCDKSSDEDRRPNPATDAPPSATGPARPMVIVATTPATKPTAPLAAGRSCVTSECHATFATAQHIHSPVAESACDACHAADMGDHQYPLKRAASETCSFCHTVAGTMSHQHKALEQGCLTCHQPHASQAKFLLNTDTIEQLCSTCHQTPLKRFAHGPFAEGQCTLCHQPHEADNAMLLRGGEGAKHCNSCHDDLRKEIRDARVAHDPAIRDCKECHSHHTTDFPHLLNSTIEQGCLRCHERVANALTSATVKHGAMQAEQSCMGCHDPHFSDHYHLMRKKMNDVCLSCHDRALVTSDGRRIANMKPVLESKFLHGAIAAGDCSACHTAHGGQIHGLLTRQFPTLSYARFSVDQYALCLQSCHSPEIVLTDRTTSLTGFRNGEVNLHFLHVNRDEKGRSCKTCHSVHGSNLPNHMASAVAFERSDWVMPIGFEKRANGGSCAPGCHAPRTYDRDSPTSLPATTATTVPTTGDGP